jgi:hypothetical protein
MYVCVRVCARAYVYVCVCAGTEGRRWYSSMHFANSALEGAGVVNTTPRPLYPEERPCVHCIGGRVGFGAGLEEHRTSRLHQDSIFGPSSP